MSPLFTPEDYEERHEKRTASAPAVPFPSEGRASARPQLDSQATTLFALTGALLRGALPRHRHRHKLDLRQDVLAQLDHDSFEFEILK